MCGCVCVNFFNILMHFININALTHGDSVDGNDGDVDDDDDDGDGMTAIMMRATTNNSVDDE